eukprot:SAG22_NODE_1299_length_4809_cov_3.052866_6_plen_36_part_01
MVSDSRVDERLALGTAVARHIGAAAAAVPAAAEQTA